MTDETVRLYPNPSIDFFALELNEIPMSETFFQIHDAYGGLIFERQLLSLKTTFDCTNLPRGIFFWQLVDKKQSVKKGKILFE